MRVSLVLIVSAIASAGAFTVPSSLKKQKTAPASFAPLVHGKTAVFLSENHDNNDNQVSKALDLQNTLNKITTTTTMTTCGLMTWLATSEMAGAAAGPDWGIFEGRTGSILHPIVMGSLFAMSLYTAFLGFQWRRQRTLGDDISSLKAKLPKLPTDYKTIQEAIDSGEEMEPKYLSELQAAIPVEQEIQALTAERKQLSSQNNRDQHYTQGAWIAFFGTLFAIEVCVTECMYVHFDVVGIYTTCCRIPHSLFLYTVIPGTTQYVCQGWKTLSRTTPLCRCRFGGLLGSCRGMRPLHAKGQRYGSQSSYCGQCVWPSSLCLASDIGTSHSVQGT
jgi:hypothetical protein